MEFSDLRGRTVKFKVQDMYVQDNKEMCHTLMCSVRNKRNVKVIKVVFYTNEVQYYTGQ